MEDAARSTQAAVISVAPCLLVLVACGGGHDPRDAHADATARDAASGVSDALDARTDTLATAPIAPFSPDQLGGGSSTKAGTVRVSYERIRNPLGSRWCTKDLHHARHPSLNPPTQ